MVKELTNQEIKKIKGYRKLFPNSIKIEVIPCEEGGYTARILDLNGEKAGATEGDNFGELISMVNWAVIDWLGIPEKYASYMPTYLPPVALAQELGEFPKAKKVEAFTQVFNLVKSYALNV